ncbi:adenylosuccinate lyase [candidate division KSB1 bacterium]|nr:adenylosuccinate lyase [candidate division KSB1 bacterium]
MIDRYTRPEMGDIWSQQTKYETWLKVEIAVCEVLAEYGQIPSDALKEIRQKANFSVERINQIEAEVKHDVIAFLTSVAEFVGPNSRFIHLGMTSSDLLDTALALQIRKAGDILIRDVEKFREILKKQARTFKNTICVGRSHGIHAEPTVFGLKFALWFDEMGRNLRRLRTALEAANVGMISGAVGTYAYIDPELEKKVCERLDLVPVAVSTQVVQRDIHAEVMTALAFIGATVEKIAIELRHLQRTEVLEAEEPFSKGQKGSSSMPHKRNPIGSENVTGLSRLLRSNLIAALENIALWHERDISHSSVERIIMPDSFILADYILNRLGNILDNLVVYPEQMIKNMQLTKGLIFSQALLLQLVQKGFSREDAYKIVQENAMRCWKDNLDFYDMVKSDTRVTRLLSEADIKQCFDPKLGAKHIDEIFSRIGI